MGLLVEGQWLDQWYDTSRTNGKFVRQASQFTNTIGDSDFPAETGRYHLYVSYACPWAHRTLIMRKLKELESIITVSVVDPIMGENGWELKHGDDFSYGLSYLYQIYTTCRPEYTGRVTVPVLWDKKNKTIVNNESSNIIRIFNSKFNHLTGNDRDFYPENLREGINQINDMVYDKVNNGVYKAGFATTQHAYDHAVTELFNALDYLEDRLNSQRFLIGNHLTEADIRLFTTLIRFDAVYYSHFKTNLRRIIDYPNLFNYLKDIYQTPGIAETVDMDHIKQHYYVSHITINPTQIVPKGPLQDFSTPHNRWDIK